MKTQLMILMFVVSALLSSCVAHQPLYPLPGDEVEQPKPTKEYYVVKPGDTLYKIAQEFGIDQKSLAKWNNIPPPYDKLRVGQKLVLSPPPNQSKVGEIVTSQQNRGGISGCEKQVTVINPTPFYHPCPPPSTHQCTGAYYFIVNASGTTKTVTIQYRQLGQIKVLNQNVQIPANDMIKSRAYEVPETFSKRDIFITCN
jgi:murein DD-endopeptidase MepM/ murein hydrolase activator NlpD